MAMNPRLLRPLATGFSPRQIAGLGLWLDAADSSTVSLDGSGNVEAWADKSGNGRNATQTTAANRPDYAGTLNGKSVVGFAGPPEALTGTNPTPGATLRTVFSVWNPGSSGATRECVIDLGDTSASGQAFAITDEVGVRVFDGFALFANNPISAPAVLTISLPSADAAAVTGRLNGLAIGQTSNSAQAISSGAIYRVGDAQNGDFPTTYALTGQVAEILVYGRVLTASEIQRVEGYLAWKWGLQSQLPYDHPYARSFPGFGSQTTPTDPDALTYLAAVAAADGTGVEVGVANAVDDFVKGCKSDGIWDAIKASCILAGARTLAGALVPLKGAAPTNNNFVSGDYNRETGLVGNGSTKYLNSNRNNNADPQDSKHVSVYVSQAHTSTASGTGSAPRYVGAGLANTGATAIGRLSSNSADAFVRLANSSATTASNAGGAVGLIGSSRSAAASYVFRHSGNNATISVASQTPDPASIDIFADTGSAFGYSNGRLAFYSIGESLDLAALDTRVSTLITAIGAAI